MKKLLITIAAVLLVGCGESQQSTPAPESKPEPSTAKAPNISIVDDAYDGNIEAVKQHLAAGTDVNAKDGETGLTPLEVATDRGDKEVVELLIAAGADVNAKGFLGDTPLHDAAIDGHKEVAELLIANGAYVNAKSRYDGTPLHNAAIDGHTEIVELLIAKGADVNAKAETGWTPLDSAERVSEDDSPEDKANKKETAELLRKHGGKTGEELKAEGK